MPIFSCCISVNEPKPVPGVPPYATSREDRGRGPSDDIFAIVNSKPQGLNADAMIEALDGLLPPPLIDIAHGYAAGPIPSIVETRVSRNDRVFKGKHVDINPGAADEDFRGVEVMLVNGRHFHAVQRLDLAQQPYVIAFSADERDYEFLRARGFEDCPHLRHYVRDGQLRHKAQQIAAPNFQKEVQAFAWRAKPGGWQAHVGQPVEFTLNMRERVCGLSDVLSELDIDDRAPMDRGDPTEILVNGVRAKCFLRTDLKGSPYMIAMVAGHKRGVIDLLHKHGFAYYKPDSNADVEAWVGTISASASWTARAVPKSTFV